MSTESTSSTSSVPQVQLNPTVDPEQARPIPSIPRESPPEPPAEPAAEEFEPAPLAPKRSSGPVEIPAKGTKLDDELEAEINAALEGVGSLAIGEAPVEGGPAAAPEATGDLELAPGTKVKAKVLSVHGDSVICDVGTRGSGVIPIRVFEEGKLPEVGEVLDVVIEKYDAAEGLVQLMPAKATVSRPAGDWNSIAQDQIVDCIVVKTNKGGLEVNVSNLRGFMPAGQVDMTFCPNLEQFVGQKLRVKVLEVNPQKRNLIVSRRSFLEISLAEIREEAWKKLAVGQKLNGRVKTLKDYGAFVDIGGVDGLLHVSEISWGRIGHPKDILHEGQEIEVQILSLDREKSKISLGMKQLLASPWQGVSDRYPPNTVAHGKVTKVTDFGAFVELEPGLEGMVHISELDHRRVHRVTDIVQPGQEIDVKVLSIDLERKRIALSIKALIARPEAAPKKSDEDLAPGGGTPYERKRKEPLKGGGTESGGRLFGSPGNE